MIIKMIITRAIKIIIIVIKITVTMKITILLKLMKIVVQSHNHCSNSDNARQEA